VDILESKLFFRLIRSIDKETQHSKYVESYELNWAGSHTYGKQLQFLFLFQWLQFLGKQTVLTRPEKWRFLKNTKFDLHNHTEIHSMRSIRSVTDVLKIVIFLFHFPYWTVVMFRLIIHVQKSHATHYLRVLELLFSWMQCNIKPTNSAVSGV
jgi:hypothetical protein